MRVFLAVWIAVVATGAMAAETAVIASDRDRCLSALRDHLTEREVFDQELDDCVEAGLITEDDVIEVGRKVDADRSR